VAIDVTVQGAHFHWILYAIEGLAILDASIGRAVWSSPVLSARLAPYPLMASKRINQIANGGNGAHRPGRAKASSGMERWLNLLRSAKALHLIVGGGSAGSSVAPQIACGSPGLDLAILGPQAVHEYRVRLIPAWTGLLAPRSRPTVPRPA